MRIADDRYRAVPAVLQSVNVSQVPQRSPFRYPGGKTWLIPCVRTWLQSQPKKPRVLIEPFAGGASIALTAVAEDLVSRARFAEIDEDVAAVWKCALSSRNAALCRKLAEFTVTKTAAKSLFASVLRSRNETDRALSVLVRNRLSHGGILAPGAGLLRKGEAGRGLHSRWYPITLVKRLHDIHGLRNRLSFSHADGFDLLHLHRTQTTTVAFVDPPYVVNGRRLYRHWDMDHERLFTVMSEFAGEFLMTYDDAPEIRSLARRFKFKTCEVAMKTTKHATKRELIIGRDLGWALG